METRRRLIQGWSKAMMADRDADLEPETLGSSPRDKCQCPIERLEAQHQFRAITAPPETFPKTGVMSGWRQSSRDCNLRLNQSR